MERLTHAAVQEAGQRLVASDGHFLAGGDVQFSVGYFFLRGDWSRMSNTAILFAKIERSTWKCGPYCETIHIRIRIECWSQLRHVYHSNLSRFASTTSNPRSQPAHSPPLHECFAITTASPDLNIAEELSPRRSRLGLWCILARSMSDRLRVADAG